MPRINAETLVEHRAQQRRAILDAARALLAEAGSGGGTGAPSLAEVGRRTGLARTSLYQYFSSREALLDAVIADVFPMWSTRIHAAMGEVSTPGDKVTAYVRTHLALVAEGEHAVVRGLVAHARDRVASAGKQMHEQMAAPLLEALGGSWELAELVQSVVFTASRMVEDGRPLDEVNAHVERLLGPFCAGLGQGTTPTEVPE